MSNEHIEVAQKNLDSAIADAVAAGERLQQCLVDVVARATVLRNATPQSGGGVPPERE